MDTNLRAPVPRRLRVRGSIQVAGTRVPARGFAVAMVAAFLGVVAIVLGCDLERTLYVAGALALGSVAIVEGRLWGRSAREVAAIAARHARRPRRMRLAPQMVFVPAVTEVQTAVRRPRWEDGDARG